MGAISKTLVSVEEYLSTSYDPDCDYVDGELEERNVGEKDHAKLQRDLLIYLHEHRREWGIFVIQEQRVQISPRRFRVPDLCVYVGPEPDEQIFISPPFLCIEVLSPEDRMNRAQWRIGDYLCLIALIHFCIKMFGVCSDMHRNWNAQPKTKRVWW